MDDVQIKPEDQQRIDAMVAHFRHQVENLYRMGYLQGAIDEATETRDKMKAAA